MAASSSLRSPLRGGILATGAVEQAQELTWERSAERLRYAYGLVPGAARDARKSMWSTGVDGICQ